MSTEYVDFMTQNPLFQQMLQEREAKGEIKGEIKMILQLLRTQFSEETAELVKLALRGVDIQDAEVMGPLEEAVAHLDKQGIDRWLKDRLPVE